MGKELLRTTRRSKRPTQSATESLAGCLQQRIARCRYRNVPNTVVVNEENSRATLYCSKMIISFDLLPSKVCESHRYQDSVDVSASIVTKCFMCLSHCFQALLSSLERIMGYLLHYDYVVDDT